MNSNVLPKIAMQSATVARADTVLPPIVLDEKLKIKSLKKIKFNEALAGKKIIKVKRMEVRTCIIFLLLKFESNLMGN